MRKLISLVVLLILCFLSILVIIMINSSKMDKYSDNSSIIRMIDCHMHTFLQEDIERIKIKSPYKLPEPFSLKMYLDHLIEKEIKISVINNVDVSIFPDSENVFRSFRELSNLEKEFPERYHGRFSIIGTIKANPEYATTERLSNTLIKGIRIVLHDKKPEEIRNDEFNSTEYMKMYHRLRKDQHLHIYAKRPATILKVLKQIPKFVTFAIDHLGTCYYYHDNQIPTNKNENYIEHMENHKNLLKEASIRGNVYFKGPGYRSDINPFKIVPLVVDILRTVGLDKVILGATDAPYVGLDNFGRSYFEEMGDGKVIDFVKTVALEVSKIVVGVDEYDLLFENGRKFFRL